MERVEGVSEDNNPKTTVSDMYDSSSYQHHIHDKNAVLFVLLNFPSPCILLLISRGCFIFCFIFVCGCLMFVSCLSSSTEPPQGGFPTIAEFRGEFVDLLLRRRPRESAVDVDLGPEIGDVVAGQPGLPG